MGCEQKCFKHLPVHAFKRTWNMRGMGTMSDHGGTTQKVSRALKPHGAEQTYSLFIYATII